ncbi:CSC1-like protein At4g02900 [Linum perenne]
MATLEDICYSAAINLLSAILFLLAFAMLRLQPVNDRVYFPKWYLKGIRGSPTNHGGFMKKFVNVDPTTYIRFLNWMPAALRMPEPELIDHAGLDSVVYIRIYLMGLKIFVPITVLAWAVLVPVNWTGGTLEKLKDLTFSNIDKLSISNIADNSPRYWAHTVMAYVFTFWTFYVIYNEYKVVANMRLQFLAGESRRADHFTVLVRNVPADPDESVADHVEHFFCVNHQEHYLLHQVVYNANKLAGLVEAKKSLKNGLTYYQNKYERNPSKRPTTKAGLFGLVGKKVDAIEYYETEIENLSKEEEMEREKVLSDANAVIPAAFVSFRSRWAAAVCAQTQQSSNPTIWLTERAPEPRDVYWDNLAIPYVELTIRRFLMAVALFFLIFFFVIPIAIVQSLATIEGIEKALPFLKPLIEVESVKSIVQGFLPGIALKIFLIILPTILMFMAKIEGFHSLSSLDRRAASKYYWFLLVNVFLGSIITGTALEQLKTFMKQSASEIPQTIGVSMPMRATFFITYIMVDGWSGIAAEVLRLVPLVIFHLKNTFLVKTEQDREQAMDPGSICFPISEPRIQLYFLMGFVYAPVTPLLLPFILVFFAFSYVIFRHQKYESGAAYWPDVHRRLLTGLVISQLLLTGLLSTKGAEELTPCLIALPIITYWFHKLCKGRFESAFVKFPLQEAMVRDTLERATEPNLNLRTYLQDAYVHPIFKQDPADNADMMIEEFDEDNPLVATKRSSKFVSDVSSGTASK